MESLKKKILVSQHVNICVKYAMLSFEIIFSSSYNFNSQLVLNQKLLVIDSHFIHIQG